MKSNNKSALCGLLFMTITTAFCATPDGKAKPLQDQQSQDVLEAMQATSTWGHPDQYGEFTGMQRYSAGNYQAAMKYFLIGARYADKLSQLSIGLMYLNGEGVQKDPVTAYAWIAIAAERKYPQFVATRDALWQQLDTQQREQAKSLTEKLSIDYGDAVAKPRMALALRQSQSEMAGSYLGFGSDSVATVAPGRTPRCGAKTIGGAPITGCGNLYVAWRWDPKQYFAARDGEWTGTVSVGALKQVGAPQAPARQPDKRKDIQ
jgi:hypothetical protein